MYVSHPLIREGAVESRAYQEAVVKAALKKNTLVVMPTALGKTVIAALLAAHFLEKDPDKKVLVMAPTRPLAAQHAERFREFLALDGPEIVLLTGQVPREKRGGLWRQAKVVSATPHVILNDLASGLYQAGDVSLAVFDEAHRAVGEYPYPSIATRLDCRILGLTASPGSTSDTIEEVCANLGIEEVIVKDERDPDVAPYVSGFDVEWREVVLPDYYWVVRNLLLELLRERLKVLKAHGVIGSASVDIPKKDLLSLMEGLQREVARSRRKDLYPALSAVSAALTIAHAIDLLETQGLASLHSFLQKTAAKAGEPRASKAIKRLAASKEFKRALAMCRTLKDRYAEPKMEALKEVVMEARRGTKIIVFTQYRDTASEIVRTLNEIEGVRAVRFVGQADRAEDQGLSQKRQLEILEGFRKGEHNILVATSVAEEGLDIPAVDLVVFYEPVPSEIRMIQRRGRTGRFSVGRVVVLMAKKTRDEGFYWSSVAKERRMKRILRGFKGAGQRERKISDWGS
ncbi:MAG: DEAD/DEAH box helicase [Methanobacteriota archaeon]|nr:MAG: DEAD/DEAH box helicase [Euryarchaeota archaeon]